LTYNGHLLPEAVSESKPKILQAGNSVKDGVKKFNEVFTPATQVKFYGLYRVRSVPANDFLFIGNIKFRNPAKDSDYLTSRRLVAESFESGDIDGTTESTKDIEDKILAKRKQIFEFDTSSGTQNTNYETMVSKKRLLNAELNRLRQEELKIIGGSEQDLRNHLTQIERRVNSGSKVTLDDYEVFDATSNTSPYTQFQAIVRERLIGEKKLDANADKNWNFETGRTIKDESKDASLRLRKKFEDARRARNTKMTEVGPIFMRIRAVLDKGRGDPVKYVEE